LLAASQPNKLQVLQLSLNVRQQEAARSLQTLISLAIAKQFDRRVRNRSPESKEIVENSKGDFTTPKYPCKNN
jgi:hypothetical protein